MEDRFSPSRLLADIAACIGFFTRLPVAGLGFREVSFANALWAAPVAGAIVGILAGLTFGIASWMALPPTLSAVAALAVALITTGSLHEDGVADVADGFGGGTTRERKLEIMKDSRNGTFGVVALVLTLLARWAAIAAIGAPGAAFAALLAAHAASRALIPGFMTMVAPARPEGLSAGVGEVPANVALAAAAIGLLALLPLGTGSAFAAVICLAFLFFGMKRLTERQIGGQTGDVLGALQQGSEILVLFVAASHFSS
ncbi:adenosylcobinamide-GDP ribazoletransferase [Mesorhizobium sp. BAC0120]|uniref:adenosylcobinamide-GDP ribazoletransferase n=1 Tax=Mesorhizobium sp. BAC0120 TaxID=3090670 RepID=UPI00298C1ED5|nr:adenosylcobinamide-GDP ribazoletransferase [Mesorhizobium sp. BAC0120]MDW6020558.1 adenosylcobinamide-GDP ribazoletransferase [Mesorhizobium sp. BAC0120]